MSFESNRSLCGIGAILIAIGSIVPLLSLVGIILLLIGMKGLAEYYHDDAIFQNALYGLVFGIIGVIAAAFVLISLFFGGLFLAGFGVIWVGIILALIIAFAFSVIQAIYYRKAFDILRAKSGEEMFGTAGLLILIGAILVIVIVGIIILLVAWILAAVAFFSMKTTAPPPPPAPPPP